MIDGIVDWIVQHAPQAPWYIFLAILLAGLGIPISVDILVVIAGFLAATVTP